MSNKIQAAKAALKHIESDLIIGIGTGSTVEALIDLLPEHISLPQQFVSSSKRTTEYLRKRGFETYSLNEAGVLDVYLDGADQVLQTGVSLKGGGGAHTLEKILASNAKCFVGLVGEEKLVSQFTFPIVIEVIPEARSAVSRAVVGMGGAPEYRIGFQTDHGNDLVDVYHLDLSDAALVERELKMLPGVVEVGLFAHRCFDLVYVGSDQSAYLLGE